MTPHHEACACKPCIVEAVLAALADRLSPTDDGGCGCEEVYAVLGRTLTALIDVGSSSGRASQEQIAEQSGLGGRRLAEICNATYVDVCIHDIVSIGSALGIAPTVFVRYPDTFPHEEVPAHLRPRPRKPRRPKDVYFIRRADGLVKIGASTDPVIRLRQLAAEHGDDLELLATIEGADFAGEKALHQHLADSRAEGEWFLPSDEVLGVVDAAARDQGAHVLSVLAVTNDGGAA